MWARGYPAAAGPVRGVLEFILGQHVSILEQRHRPFLTLPRVILAGSGPLHFRGELLLPDVGQALAQFRDQRIAIGQDALQVVGRVA